MPNKSFFELTLIINAYSYKSLVRFLTVEGLSFYFNSKLLISIFLFGITSISQAQILDDSTKQIYGPSTTTFITEQDFLWNNYNRVETDTSLNVMWGIHRIDTTINYLHNYNFLFDTTKAYQDLGNFITPIMPIFLEHQHVIGKRLGFEVFDRYAYDPQAIRYYDSKSPYSSLYYVQGGKRQQIMEVEHSRNVLYNWNLGMTLRRMTSQKVVGAIAPIGTGTQEKIQASHYTFSLYTRYFSKNERYQILGNLTHLHHTNFDYGGIVKTYLPDSIKNDSIDNTFLYEDEKVNLHYARTIEKRINYHLYQEYNLDKKKFFQIYHISNYTKRINRFNDVVVLGGNKSYDFDYYNKSPFFLVPTDTIFKTIPLQNGQKVDSVYLDSTIFKYTDWAIFDRTEFTEWNHTIGFKGTIGKLFSGLYLKRRNFTYLQPGYNRDTIPGRPLIPIEGVDSNERRTNAFKDNHPVDREFIENFVGGRFLYSISNRSKVRLVGEYLFSGNQVNGKPSMKDYNIEMAYFNSFMEAGFSKSMFSPTLLQQEYRGNVFQWNFNDSTKLFQQTHSTYAFGGLKLRNKWIAFYPKITYNRMDNFIYYDTLVQPKQSLKPVQFLSYELLLKFNIRKFHFQLFGKYTSDKNSEPVYRVPGIYTRNTIYFESFLFKGATLIQVGVEQSWKSGYNPYKYMPVTNQFYLNDGAQVRSIKNYTLIDVFLNIQIKSVRAFVKLSHANQAPDKGYYITPYYSGLPRTFDFGINWRFYD